MGVGGVKGFLDNVKQMQKWYFGAYLMQLSDGVAVVIGSISMVGQWLPGDKSSDSEQQTTIWSA